MRHFGPHLFSVVVLSLLILLAPWSADSAVRKVQAEPVSVLTRSYDNRRIGANLNETRLNTTNVNAEQFGKLFSRPVQGHIYAQPLYVPALEVPGKGIHNVVFVATMHNMVYAFDADNPAANEPLWQRNLGPSVPLRDPNIGEEGGIPYLDISTEIGIIGTPVIDPATGTLYVVAMVKPAPGKYEHHLHALDIKTGQDRTSSPVTIQASIPGKGRNSFNNVVRFDSVYHNQRIGLLLSKGVVYFAFASYADSGEYHGWVLGYDAITLAQVLVFNPTPDGDDGGIWMSAQGISVDGNGDLYFVVGNGHFNAHEGGQDYGNAIVRLRPTRGKPTVESWFVPYNYEYLNQIDLDMGSTGAMLVPGTNLVLAGSKQGKLYLVYDQKMGGFSEERDTQIVQTFQATAGRHIHGSPVFWASPEGPNIYIWGEEDFMRVFRFKDGKMDTNPVALSTVKPPNGMPGGIMSVSANGSTPGSGIIWAAHPASGNANQGVRPGILRAFDASNVGVELWNSLQIPERDDMGNLAKFNMPVVANGKVYMATFSNQLVVYGPLTREKGGRGGSSGKR